MNRFLFQGRNTSYAIGDTGPAGGIIFYVRTIPIEGSYNYLEAALGSSSGSTTGDTLTIRYSNVLESCGATGTTVGSGLDNTLLIIDQTGMTDSVAKRCYDFEFGGYSDWYLPSLDELNLMYENLHVNGLGYFTSISYWASTEGNTTQAYRITFSTGVASLQTKTTTYRFRPIRQF